MTDTLSQSDRSRVMARIRGKDTKPELTVRRLVYGMGFRYRLHDRRFPGTPDLVFHGRKKAIFVHGCFWHRHPDCAMARLPKSKQEFWVPKLEENRRRDLVKISALESKGWRVFIVWECEIKDEVVLAVRLRDFLNAGG